MMSSKTGTRLCILILAMVSLNACSEYWWSRGQPPAPDTLLSRSRVRLEQAREQFGMQRKSIATSSKLIEEALVESLNQASAGEFENASRSVDTVIAAFESIETDLAVVSRAAYGELSGQMLNFRQRLKTGSNFKQEAFTLFAARTLFFLSRELHNPGDAFG